MKNQDIRKRTLYGTVVSDKMEKTIVVLVERRVKHPILKKMIIRSKKYKAHDGKREAKKGDRVKIVECRPISKQKAFRLAGIISR